MKSFADEAPRMLLHLLGIAPLDADVTVTPLPRETAPTAKVTDYAAAVAVNYRGKFVFHVEFLTWYRSAVVAQMAEYGVSLALQHRLPVVSVLLLLRPNGVPNWIPRKGTFQIGGTSITHPFRTVRIWEIDPAPLLESNDIRLFPWAVLMKSSGEQVRRMAAALATAGDDELIGRFLSLGTVRYDREELEQMVGGPKMGLVEAILEGSFVVKELQEKARAGEARKLLRTALEAKFPGLDQLPELDAISDIGALESLFEKVVTSSDRAQIEQGIRAGATMKA